MVDTSAGNAPYTKIAGDFVIPDVSSSTQDSYECSWVGLGGYGDARLIQAGTESDATTHWFGPTTANYYVWTEQLPDQPTEQMISNFPVSPGDQMYVHLEYGTHIDSSGVEVGNATFYIQDLTKNTYTSFTSGVNAMNDYFGGTAEWVDERPAFNNVPASLANFNTVQWTNLFAANPSDSKKLGDWGRDQIIMENGTNVLASPLASYDYNTNSFVNRWFDYN